MNLERRLWTVHDRLRFVVAVRDLGSSGRFGRGWVIYDRCDSEARAVQGRMDIAASTSRFYRSVLRVSDNEVVQIFV